MTKIIDWLACWLYGHIYDLGYHPNRLDKTRYIKCVRCRRQSLAIYRGCPDIDDGVGQDYDDEEGGDE